MKHNLLPEYFGGVGDSLLRRARCFTAVAFSLMYVNGASEAGLVSLANPMQGTDSKRDFSSGNTYPAIALPFPMHTWAPYTQPENDSFFYQYKQTKIRGIRQTHQPSPWIGDYGTFALMPVSGKLAVNERDRASEFRHEAEFAEPSYYRVYLDTWQATAEVTPTERAARFRFTFDSTNESYVVLDAFPGGSWVKIIPGENKIVGGTHYISKNHRNNGGVPDNFTNYFVLVFDRPFVAQGVWNPAGVQNGVQQLAGDHVGAFLQFETAKDRSVGCKVASSYISLEQAERNLEREIGSADFDTIRQRAEARWNEMMGRVQVEGGLPDQRRTFYSALYRVLLFPHKMHEIDGENRNVYFSPYDGTVHEGVYYTDVGFWDTFRAANPLYNLLYPEMSAELMQGIIAAYEQSGWLPSWASAGHASCMIGNHAFSLLADAWVKGIRSFDLHKAVAAMQHDATTQAPEFCRSIGRDGAQEYGQLGYVPYSYVKGEPSYKEATAKTLEYAYDDFCAGLLARAAGRTQEEQQFRRWAMNWTNVFDATTGFVRGRQANGKWCEPFDPTEWGGPFTEGSSWHWTWSVMQDVPGLISRMGGQKAFADKLDEAFATPNTLKVGTYGRMIHEMTEMVALNMGQYAHANEPVHHMVYLYNYAGQPWKAQVRLRQVMTLLYHATPDGLCGDEDTGQTSAWYVFSALGFYPVCPGTPDYLIGSPLFDRVTLTLPQNKTFTITARSNGPLRPYIQSATLNGQPFDRTYLTHEQIVRGGALGFEMGAAPNYTWGVGAGKSPAGGLDQLEAIAAESPQAKPPLRPANNKTAQIELHK